MKNISSLWKVTSVPIALRIPTIYFIPVPSPAHPAVWVALWKVSCLFHTFPRLSCFVSAVAWGKQWLWRCRLMAKRDFQILLCHRWSPMLIGLLLPDAIRDSYLHHGRQQTWLEWNCERFGDSKCCRNCCLLLTGWWIVSSVLEKITRVLYRYTEYRNMCQGLTSAYRKLML